MEKQQRIISPLKSCTYKRRRRKRRKNTQWVGVPWGFFPLHHLWFYNCEANYSVWGLLESAKTGKDTNERGEEFGIPGKMSPFSIHNYFHVSGKFQTTVNDLFPAKWSSGLDVKIALSCWKGFTQRPISQNITPPPSFISLFCKSLCKAASCCRVSVSAVVWALHVICCCGRSRMLQREGRHVNKQPLLLPGRLDLRRTQTHTCGQTKRQNRPMRVSGGLQGILGVDRDIKKHTIPLD